jgi:hypothetical protein
VSCGHPGPFGKDWEHFGNCRLCSGSMQLKSPVKGRRNTGTSHQRPWGGLPSQPLVLWRKTRGPDPMGWWGTCHCAQPLVKRLFLLPLNLRLFPPTPQWRNSVAGTGKTARGDIGEDMCACLVALCDHCTCACHTSCLSLVSAPSLLTTQTLCDPGAVRPACCCFM